MFTILSELALTLSLLSTTITQAQAQITPYAVNAPEIQENTQTTESLTQGQIRAVIASYARKNGIPEVTSLAIAKCESGFNPEAKNPKSSARGIFQFLTSTRQETARRMGTPDFDPFDVEDSANAATWLLAQGEISRWNSSKNCWSKEL